jgi:hypothetical protein
MPPIPPPQSVLQWRPLVAQIIVAHALGVTADEALAIVQKESWGEKFAVNPNDPSFGLGQVELPEAKMYAGILTLPARSSDPLARKTKPSYGYDTSHPIFIPENNLLALARYLSHLKARFAADWPMKNPERGWMCSYNLGETRFAKGVADPGYVAAVAQNLSALGASA